MKNFSNHLSMEFTGERYVPERSGEIAYEHLNRYHFALNQVDLTDKVVLDIASGEGYGTNLLAQFARYAYGVDISPEAIEHAKAKYNKKNLSFIVGDAISIPLEDNSVDVVVSFETIEHLDGHQKMIDEIKRVLKKDGILIISSPDKSNYNARGEDDNHFHVKELTYNEFKILINKNFKKSFFFNQKIFVGSIIVVDEEFPQYKNPLFINDEGNKIPLNAKYNIAVCTDMLSISLNYNMINYSGLDRIIIPEELLHANYEGQLHVNKSLSYRIGNAILKPIKKLQTMFVS